jgi:hypothetical protein
MIRNIAPEDIRKYQITFENIPKALEATAPFIEGLQGIELTHKPSDRPWPVQMNSTCEVVDNTHSPVSRFMRDWVDASKAQQVEAPYIIYGVPGGAIVEYKWPCFKIKFRSLRLARMFAKTYKIDWQIETVEA